MLPHSTFVLGGAASGKSAWAEKLILNSGLKPVYLATGTIEDKETEHRVSIHKARRDARWRLIEAPLELAAPLSELQTGEAVLIDCATMWLSNHLLADHDLHLAKRALLTALQNCPVPWIIVSNEVGHGIVPDNALARQFREAQGRLNIALAAQAQLAVQIIAGLPQVLKGKLP